MLAKKNNETAKPAPSKMRPKKRAGIQENMPRLARLWIRGLAALALPSLSPAEAELQRWVQPPKLDLQAPAANSKHPLQMTMDSTPSVGHGANVIWHLAGRCPGRRQASACEPAVIPFYSARLAIPSPRSVGQRCVVSVCIPSHCRPLNFKCTRACSAGILAFSKTVLNWTPRRCGWMLDADAGLADTF